MHGFEQNIFGQTFLEVVACKRGRYHHPLRTNEAGTTTHYVQTCGVWACVVECGYAPQSPPSQ